MTKKITKKDPQTELAGFLEHQSEQKNKQHQTKVSDRLTKLKQERKRSLKRRLGTIIGVSSIAILGLGYYISPQSFVESVSVKAIPGISAQKLVNASGLSAKDKVVDTLTHQAQLSSKITHKYPEIKSVSFSLNSINHLQIKPKLKAVTGYIKINNQYFRILANGQVGTAGLSYDLIDASKPLFIGYSKDVSLTQDLAIFSKMSPSLREQVKVMSGQTSRASQIIFIMKDKNVIVGNTATILTKLKYYDEIKATITQPSLIDLEVGAFSRALTPVELKSYGLV